MGKKSQTTGYKIKNSQEKIPCEPLHLLLFPESFYLTKLKILAFGKLGESIINFHHLISVSKRCLTTTASFKNLFTLIFFYC
jgi:hypothetical protein